MTVKNIKRTAPKASPVASKLNDQAARIVGACIGAETAKGSELEGAQAAYALAIGAAKAGEVVALSLACEGLEPLNGETYLAGLGALIAKHVDANTGEGKHWQARSSSTKKSELRVFVVGRSQGLKPRPGEALQGCLRRFGWELRKMGVPGFTWSEEAKAKGLHLASTWEDATAKGAPTGTREAPAKVEPKTRKALRVIGECDQQLLLGLASLCGDMSRRKALAAYVAEQVALIAAPKAKAAGKAKPVAAAPAAPDVASIVAAVMAAMQQAA